LDQIGARVRLPWSACSRLVTVRANFGHRVTPVWTKSQIDLGRLLVRVAAPPRAAEGLGRLPVRVAVAGAAVGAAAHPTLAGDRRRFKAAPARDPSLLSLSVQRLAASELPALALGHPFSVVVAEPEQSVRQ
jgi:hypothetical protein